jgi:hypothetical protein
MRFPAENHKRSGHRAKHSDAGAWPGRNASKGRVPQVTVHLGVVALLGHSNELLPNRLFPNSHRLFLCYTFPCHSHDFTSDS